MDMKNRVVNEKTKQILRRLVRWTVNILYWLSILAVAYVCVQVFLFASFRIPSDSMAPGLHAGDQVLVSKPILGARLFNLFATLRHEQVRIYRAPGWRDIRWNDVVVFNYPYPNSGERMEMHILKYYIKRCVGLPGDTLRIHNGLYHAEKTLLLLGNREYQEQIRDRTEESFAPAVWNTFPYDSVVKWNIREFGPIYIPRAGDERPMSRLNYLLYRRMIEWEQHGTLEYHDSTAYLDGVPLLSYRFQKNYYFMAGDYALDSRDSRYWGLVPEEYIVGKAWIIWKSVDPHTGKFRWERFLKTIY
jgi:signal peptidase I